MFNLEVSCRTKKGNNRELNEDSLIASKIGDRYIIAIADGLGGHASGEIASKMAINQLLDALNKSTPDVALHDTIAKAIEKANTAIYLLSKENQTCKGMASTLVTAVISQKEVVIANVGDSRAYCVGENITRITKDHSFVQQLVDNGLISEEEAFTHEKRNLITMSLGRRRDIYPDYFDIVISGRVLLLCSDGLTNALKDEEIKVAVNDSSTLEEACNNLLNKAEAKDASDDISIVLIRETK